MTCSVNWKCTAHLKLTVETRVPRASPVLPRDHLSQVVEVGGAEAPPPPARVCACAEEEVVQDEGDAAGGTGRDAFVVA